MLVRTALSAELSRLGLLVLLAAGASACSTPSQATHGPSAELRAFAGAPTRVVWVQGDGTDPYAAGHNLILMGLDSDDHRGERVILGERNSYAKPMITPRGDRIVYTRDPSGDAPEIFVVNWDGSGHRKLMDGSALDLWRNPEDGSEWLYAGTGMKNYEASAVVRLRLDDPALQTELVWNKTRVSSDTFQVSADGRHAGGLFPWPTAGIATLPNGDLRHVGDGCWTAMATARGPLLWYFDGAHRNLLMVDAQSDRRWTVPVNTAPGFDNPEVYHPRWSNHPRFMTLSGPYNQGGANQVRSGGRQSEVWVGRFSEDFTRIEAWHRVTHNDGGDSYPDVWVDLDRTTVALRPSGRIGPADAPATEGNGEEAAGGGAASRLVVEARLAHAGPIPTPESIAPYRHALVVNEYDVVTLVEGRYERQKIQVAQWAIRDRRVLAEARKTPGSVHRLTVERYDAHPELEGERLITDLPASDLPLYYEVGS